MGKSNKTTQTQKNTALQPFLGAYGQTLSQAQQTAGQPFTPYPGQLVAPFSPMQNQGFGIVGNAAGQSGYDIAKPYFGTAQSDFGAATAPLWSGLPQFSGSEINQFLSPYTQDVVDQTQKSFNLSNAEQASNLQGSAAAAGAFGGDREAVMQGELAKQQNAAQAPVIANLWQQGFGQAEQEFNTQQAAQLGADEANRWLSSQAAFGESALGSEAQNAAFTGAGQLNAAGGEQQALSQEQLNVPYEQWVQQQAYPFQTESWLANMETGLGGAAGSQSTGTTKQSTNLLSQILGGLMGGVGMIGSSGGFGSNGWLTGSNGIFASNPYAGLGYTPGMGYGVPPLMSSQNGYNGPYSRGGGIGRVIPFPMHRARPPGMGRGIFHRGAFGAGGLVPDVSVSIVPDNDAFGHTMGPPKANAMPQPSGGGSGGGGGGLSSLASLASTASSLLAMGKGGGIVRRPEGGLIPESDDLPPANDDAPPDDNEIRVTGTDSDRMPYPSINYKPQKMPDTWSEDLSRAPWMALMAAGADMMGTGNIGHGFSAGLKAYEGIRDKAQERQAKSIEVNNEGDYRQAEVERGADELFATVHDAAVRNKETSRHNLADEANTAAMRDIERTRTGIEGANSATERDRLLWDETKHNWTPGEQNGVQGSYDETGAFHPGMITTVKPPSDELTAGERLAAGQKEYLRRFGQHPGIDESLKPGSPTYDQWAQQNGYPSPGRQPVKPAATTTPPPVQPAAGGQPPRPKGVPDAALRANAQVAIKTNPQARAQVLARLKAWGVPTSGL